MRNEVKVRGENNELHIASNLVLLVMWKGMSRRDKYDVRAEARA